MEIGPHVIVLALIQEIEPVAGGAIIRMLTEVQTYVLNQVIVPIVPLCELAGVTGETKVRIRFWTPGHPDIYNELHSAKPKPDGRAIIFEAKSGPYSLPVEGAYSLDAMIGNRLLARRPMAVRIVR